MHYDNATYLVIMVLYMLRVWNILDSMWTDIFLLYARWLVEKGAHNDQRNFDKCQIVLANYWDRAFLELS